MVLAGVNHQACWPHVQSSHSFLPICKTSTCKMQQPSFKRHSQRGAGLVNGAGQACRGKTDPPDATAFAVHAHPVWFWAVRLRPLRRQTLKVPPWSPVTAAWPSGAQAAAVSADSLQHHIPVHQAWHITPEAHHENPVWYQQHLVHRQDQTWQPQLTEQLLMRFDIWLQLDFL